MPPATIAILFGIAVVAAVLIFQLQTKRYAVKTTQTMNSQAQWHTPAELLSSPPPRAVRYTTSGKFLLGFPAFMMAAGLAYLIFLGIPQFNRSTRRIQLLNSEGVAGSATITNRWMVSGKSPTYNVTYAYEANGRPYRSNARVSGRSYGRMERGSRTTIHYAASQPEISRMDLELVQPPWVVFLPLVVLPFFSLMTLILFRQKKLLVWGQASNATITRVSRAKGGRNVRYEFRDPTGNMVRGSAVVSSLMAPAPGENVTILFDPNRPGRSTIYPTRLVELVSTYWSKSPIT